MPLCFNCGDTLDNFNYSGLFDKVTGEPVCDFCFRDSNSNKEAEGESDTDLNPESPNWTCYGDTEEWI